MLQGECEPLHCLKGPSVASFTGIQACLEDQISTLCAWYQPNFYECKTVQKIPHLTQKHKKKTYLHTQHGAIAINLGKDKSLLTFIEYNKQLEIRKIKKQFIYKTF